MATTKRLITVSLLLCALWALFVETDFITFWLASILLISGTYIVFRVVQWVAIWVGVWVFGHWEPVARERNEAFDESLGLTLAELLVEMGFPIGEPGALPVARRRVARMRDLQHALAEEAYFEFGYRRRDEANEMITRKFMRDLLRDRPDLRAKDALAAIDGALTLSFFPSRELQLSNVLDNTWSTAARADPMGLPMSRGLLGWLRRFWRVDPPAAQEL